MRNRGPLLTLVAVVGLALALVGLNLGVQPAAAPPRAAAVAAPGPPPVASPAAPPTPAPNPAEAAPAPADSPPAPPAGFPAEAGYAGRTAGGEATIAIAVRDGRAVGYLCDGHRIEAWLQGGVTGPTLALDGPRGAGVRATLTGDAVFGQIAAGGRSWPFAAQLATAPAGTYTGSVSVRGVLKRIGWNVLPDGTVTGLVSDPTGVAPAPALDPARRAASLDGLPVPVTALRGSDRVIG